MGLPKKPQFQINIQHEIEKVKNLLELPITNISFSGTTAKIYIKAGEIGSLEFVDVPGTVVTRSYYTPDEAVNKLNWSKVLIQERDILISKAQEIKPEAITITPGHYKMAYLKGGNGIDLGKVFCRYTNNEWYTIEIK